MVHIDQFLEDQQSSKTVKYNKIYIIQTILQQFFKLRKDNGKKNKFCFFMFS